MIYKPIIYYLGINARNYDSFEQRFAEEVAEGSMNFMVEGYGISQDVAQPDKKPIIVEKIKRMSIETCLKDLINNISITTKKQVMVYILKFLFHR